MGSSWFAPDDEAKHAPNYLLSWAPKKGAQLDSHSFSLFFNELVCAKFEMRLIRVLAIKYVVSIWDVAGHPPGNDALN